MRSRATSVTIADVIIEFLDNDNGYTAWLADHPDGYVLNCERPPRPSYLTLHRATCWTINRTSGTNWTVNYQKVCADTSEESKPGLARSDRRGAAGFCAPGSPVVPGRLAAVRPGTDSAFSSGP